MSKFWKQITTKQPDSAEYQMDSLITHYSDMQSLVDISDVSIGFHHWFKIKYILENVNLKFYPNEIVALLGANGAGKTTLINAISGIIKKQKGKITLNRENLSMDEFIGIQFQDLKFPQGLTVRNMLDFQMNLLDRPISISLLKDMLDTFKLTPMLNKIVSKLSGGQQQRLNVLLALITKPKILILDEFTTGLDIASKKDITNFIHRFTKEYQISVILISHDTDVIKSLTERFIVLAKKTVMVDALRADVLRKFTDIDEFLAYYIK